MLGFTSTMFFCLPFVFLASAQGIVANKLGRPFSILHGLKPVLPVQEDFSSVFYPVKKTKLFKNIQHETVETNDPYFSDFVQLTYHRDEKDLIKTFFSIWQFKDETRDAAPFTYQPSLGDTSTSTKDTYATLLGISPENMVGKSYVLARYWKKFKTIKITSADFSDLKTSAFSSKSTSDQITRLFAEYGTHYVSGYEMGDMIYQVFVYDKDKAKVILRHFDFDDPISNFGPESFSFRVFTLKTYQGNTGHCREAGRILSASGDSALDSLRPKLKDNVYMVDESIFMFTATPNGYKMMNNLTKVIPLKIFVKPIVNKLLQPGSSSKSKWNGVLAATIFQKFGQASSPNFPEIPEIRVQDVYDSFNPDLVTSTATNYVTITRMTFRLDDFFVLNPEYVTHLFIFADVLEISQTAKLKLPGSKKIYLVCRKFVALSSGNNAPEIIVGSHGKPDPVLKIIAKEFRGILKVSQANQGTHRTYANKLVYETVRDPDLQDLYTVKTKNSKKLLYPDSQTVPELYETKEKSLEGNWLRGSLVNSFELAVASVQTILTVHTSEESTNKARKTLEWITETLVEGTDNSTNLSADLEMILGRALLITKTQLTEYAKARVIVPRLSFPQYKKLFMSFLATVSAHETKFREVTREINRRRQMETVTKSLKELNKNVKSIGSFLLEKTGVNAKYQADIAKTQKDLHDLEKDRIDREQGKAAQIMEEIIKIQGKIDTVTQNLKEGLTKYQYEQIGKAAFTVFQVLGSLFTGGVGLTHIAADIQGIVRVADKVKNVMTIIEQVQKVYDLGITMRNDIGTINRAMENMPNIQIDTFPTELEWDDFDTDVDSYLSKIFLLKDVDREALDYQSCAKRLSARGRKYISIAANIATFKYKQIQIEMERDLAKRQSSRLRELKTKLNQNDLSDNDAKTTDLFELGNIIKMKENQVRSQLVQTFVVMDAAMQYYYLQEATLIERFDTMAIHRAATNQIQSSISALENFPSLPKDLKKPIEYNIPAVPVKDLLSKDGYKVTIPLSSLPFHDFVRARILRMEVRADNILKSADNTVYIQATASGESFQDRDLDRNPKIYSTFPTEYRTVYNINDNETLGKTSEEFSSRFIKITPFDDWVFCIQNVTTNKGIQFKSNITTLRIKFYLRAIFQPARLSSDDRPVHGKLSDDVRGSKEELLGILDGRSLVREWDAIMAVNAKRVNELWQKQYDDQTNAGFVRRIVTERRLAYDTGDFKSETRLTIDVGPPRIQFVPNNPNKAVMKIKIKSALIEYWDRSESGYSRNHNKSVALSDDTEIHGVMNLLKIRGSLTEDCKVVLDLSKGVFDFLNLDLTNDHIKMTSVNEINIFFNNKLKSKDFEVAKITYECELTPASLVPKSFYLATGGFGTIENPSLGTLFIFFRTSSSNEILNVNTKKEFNDPLSLDHQIIPTGFEVALFISNRIIFNDFIKKDIKDHFHFDVCTKDNGKSISESQKSVYVVGESEASYTISNIYINFDRSPKSAYVNFRIPGHTLKAQSIDVGQKIQVHWKNSNFDVNIPYLESDFRGLHHWIEWDTATFSTSYNKSFTPSIDSDLTISYTEEGSASGSSQKTPWYLYFLPGTYNYDVSKKVIASKVNEYMNGLVSFNFRSISVFAITQVVFPNKNAFHFTEVYIPGDMVILGNIRSN